MHGLRVSGGTLRGRKLHVDPREGVRPTSERARQAYFNIVAGQLPGSRFLDLYAGSGIFSFEAVSRGAREALAIDLSSTNVRSIQNAADDWSVAVRAEAMKLPDSLVRLTSGHGFDLVYADPPYNLADYDALLAALSESVPLQDGAIVAIEHRSGSKTVIPETAGRLRHSRSTQYGNVSIAFFDLSEPNVHE